MMSKSCRIEFEYQYKGYAAIRPFNPSEKSKERKQLRKAELLGRFYKPKYPAYPLGEIFNIPIIDLREEGIRLKGGYGGTITIELKELKCGGFIKVGSIDDRDLFHHQWVYRYRKGTKYHNVWIGMPAAIFKVTLHLKMPNSNYNALQKTIKAFEKITPEEVAELRTDQFIERFDSLVMTETIDDISLDEGVRKAVDEVSIEKLGQFKEFLKTLLGTDSMEGLALVLNELRDEKEKKRQKLTEFILSQIKDSDLRKVWTSALSEVGQALLRDAQQKSKRKQESRARRRARRELKILKESDVVCKDIFEIFRFYMNIHLATVKYYLGQIWIEPIPEWEVDFFYYDNEVRMDNDVLVNQAKYSLGAIVQHPRSMNIDSAKWSEMMNLPISQMREISTGFYGDSIFTKAYESLVANEAEVFIVLVDAGLESAFRFLRHHIPKTKLEWLARIGLPNLDSKDVSLGSFIEGAEKSFLEHGPLASKSFSRTRIRALWQCLKYIHRLRNYILHFKGIVEKQIYLAQQGNDRTGIGAPLDYGIKLDKDPYCLRHTDPYWWRVMHHVYAAARDVDQLCTLFKQYIVANSSEPAEAGKKESGMRGFLRRIRSRLM